LQVLEGAEVTVSSTGLESGTAGNLDITAESINLNEQGKIKAETEAGQGGNITLQDLDVLVLGNNSKISTSAGTAQASGDGGNISITTDNLAALNNSDITANAGKGNGGQVEIKAQGIFGIEARNKPTLESDITASSDLGVQFSGDVNINTPEIDPEAGLNELPTVPIDADALIAQNLCTLKDGRLAGGSSFIILGRGGLPPSADEPSTNKTRIVDWATSSPELSSERLKPREREAQNEISAEKPTTSPVIEQALGWAKTKDGKIVLTANAPVTVSPTGAISFPNCNQ
jgi:large exoprotein involved in heme utilization and adhesion